MIWRSEKLIKNPEVLVHVQTYNHEKYVKKALESVYSQRTSFDFVVMITDDCSCDGTRAILEAYYKQNESRTILIENEQNMFSQRNYSFAFHNIQMIPQAKYIAILEGDDYYLEGKLQEQYDAIEANSGLSVITHLTKLVDEITGKETIIPSDKRVTCGHASTKELANRCIMQGCYFSANSLFFRAECLQGVDLENDFWNCYTGDVATFLYLLTCGGMQCIPKVLSAKRVNNTNSLSYKNNADEKNRTEIINGINDRIKQLTLYDEMTSFASHAVIQNKTLLYVAEKIQLDNDEVQLFQGYRGVLYTSYGGCRVLSFTHKALNKLFQRIVEPEKWDTIFIHITIKKIKKKYHLI